MEVVDGGIVANDGVIPSSVGVEDRGVDVEGKDVVEDNCRALASVLGVGDVVVVANKGETVISLDEVTVGDV